MKMKVQKDFNSIVNNDSTLLSMRYHEASSLADIFLWFQWVVTDFDRPTYDKLKVRVFKNIEFIDTGEIKLMITHHERSFIKGMCLLLQLDKGMAGAWMQPTAKKMVNAL